MTPVFFSLLIVYFQWLADNFTTASIPNPTRNIDSIARCMGDGCITVGYGIVVRVGQR